MRTLSIIGILAGMLLGGCASIKVTSDQDTSIDFNKYQTFEYYGWEEESDKVLNRFDKERIEEAFGNEFNNRGLQHTKNGGDLIVKLYIVTEQKTKTTAHTNHYGGGYADYYDYGPGWDWGGGHSTTTYNQYDYEVGTLICSVYDKQAQQLIWEGVGSGTMEENPQIRERKIPLDVAQIMDMYPMKPLE